jgi:hypothetical protein
MRERAVWLALGLLHEVDDAVHRLIDRLLAVADDLRSRRS